MNADFRQFILLAIAVAVPLFLYWRRQPRLLLGWICLTLFIQIFDTTIVTNLPASRVAGLLYLPIAIAELHNYVRIQPVRLLLLNLVYLTLLGLAFGFIWPWPDLTFNRPFTLIAPGRTIIYLIRLISDLSLTILLVQLLQQVPKSLLTVGRAVALGGALNALVGMINFAAGVDVFYLVTGIGETILLTGRARGLAIEPRAMGMCCDYGLIVLLLLRHRLSSWWLLLLVINLVGVLITYSISSLVLLGFGLLTATIFLSNRVRMLVLLTGVLLASTVIASWVYLPERFDQASQVIRKRIDPEYKLEGIPAGNLGEELAYRLDVFDASAFLFLLDKPVYAVFGSGPGLIALPASAYIPQGLYSQIWTPEVGINSPPSSGLLLEISNSGLVGLLFWFLQCTSCLAALRYLVTKLPDADERSEWEFAFALFLIGAVLYLVHTSHTPVWGLMLSLGWAAVFKAEEVAAYLSERARRDDYRRASLAPDLLLSNQ
jgi:hypothetical protein